MPAMHRDHRCLSPGSAQLLYIREASSGLSHYGMHLYRLHNSKKHGSRSGERSDRSDSGNPCEYRTLERVRKTSDAGGACGTKTGDALSNQRVTLAGASSLPSVNSGCPSTENPASEMHPGTVWLGICGRGIDIYEVT